MFGSRVCGYKCRSYIIILKYQDIPLLSLFFSPALYVWFTGGKIVVALYIKNVHDANSCFFYPVLLRDIAFGTMYNY